jgi:hypothetical protein
VRFFVTLSEAKTALSALGYDVVDIFAVKNGHAVFQDTAGNVRVKNLNDTRFRGLRGRSTMTTPATAKPPYKLP